MAIKLFCSRCGAENTDEYTYCVGCGEPLEKPVRPVAEPCSAQASSSCVLGPTPVIEDAPVVEEEPTVEEVPADAIVAPAESICTIPLESVEAFVGTNKQKVVPNLKRASSEGKAGFNFIAFLLGLGGLSFVYFFYRKMYKVGAILAAITAAIYGVYFVAYAQIMRLCTPFMEFLGAPRPTFQHSDQLMPIVLQMLVLELFLIVVLAAIIVLAIIVGKKANKWYYNHMLGCFFSTPDPALAIKKGGTNKGLAIASGIVWYVAMESVIFALLIPFISEYMNVILTMSI